MERAFGFDLGCLYQDNGRYVIDMSVPPSVGESTVMNNLGRMRNKGIEFDVTGLIVNTKNWRFSLKVNGAHNTNKIWQLVMPC